MPRPWLLPLSLGMRLGVPTWKLLEEGDCFRLLTLCNVEQLLPIGREVEGTKVDWVGKGLKDDECAIKS